MDSERHNTKLELKDRIRIIVMSVFIWLIISIVLILLMKGFSL